MAATKAEKFVDSICNKTLDGQIEWERTAEAGKFQATLGNYIVMFSEGDDFPGEFELSIYNLAEELVERYESTYMGGNLANQMAKAHRQARHQAMGVDQALDDLLGELGSADKA
jgi:hypothetical protein